MSKTESIENQAYALLNRCFLGWREVPASLSGMFHGNESMEKHIKNVVSVTNHLCDCYAISAEDRDMLVGAAILHDMGKFVISTPSKIMIKGWKYYPRTDYSRIEGLYKIDRKDELKAIVASHMHRFAPEAPQPITFYQHLICLADFIGTIDSMDILLNWKPRENDK